MSAPLTEEESKQYTAVIDAILSTANLETVSRKKIRQGLEKALGGKDLSEQKRAIKALIEDRFDAINSQTQSSGNMPTPPSHSATYEERGRPTPKRERSETNGHLEDDEEDADGEIEVSVSQQPAKKKQKRVTVVDEDARLAAELQAQEDRLAKGRATRGGGTAKSSKPKKKAPKKKSAAKIKGEDDSDIESSEASGVKEKRKASGGFQKPFNLSYPLGELCGQTQLSRPQVVKKLWEHIKGNELQDPTDKRQIRCDDKMQAVFKQTRVDMFQMNKLLGAHLYPTDEE